MVTLLVRFYAELNDLLPPHRRQVAFGATLGDGARVRELLAANGVPEDAVDLVLVNGTSAPVDRPLHDGDRVSVYPVFEAMDIAGLGQIREGPLRRTRFRAVPELRRLVLYLRLLGFDADCASIDSAALQSEGAGARILLTRDRGLIAALGSTHAIVVESASPRAQLREVLERLHLPARAQLPPRCLRCNRTLQARGGASRCPECGHRRSPSTLRLAARLVPHLGRQERRA